jgi:hypothetical protein
MPEFRVLTKGSPADYQAAADKISKELSEALLQASVRAGLSQTDPIFSIMVAQAELLSAGFSKHAELIKASIKAALSPRSEEIKNHTAALTQSVAESTRTSGVIAHATETYAAQVEMLERQVAAMVQQALETEKRIEAALKTHADLYLAQYAAVKQIGEQYRDLKGRNLAVGLGLAALIGSVLTLISVHLLHFAP